MTNSTTVHDIKAMVLSYHSLLVMETVEEERVTSVLQAVARDLRVPLFDWSLTRGLVRSSSGPFAGTENPAMMLKQIEEFTSEAIFLLKDFSSHLQNDTVRRTFRELVGEFQGSRSTFVLTGDPVELPRDLEKLAVKVDFCLPEQAELKEMINSLVRIEASGVEVSAVRHHHDGWWNLAGQTSYVSAIP